MRKVYIFFLLLFIALSSCEKKATVYTTMTVQVLGDSSWTTTDVTTENDNNIVYINATNSVLNKEVCLILNHYESGNRTYTVGNTGTVHANVSQSGAEYQTSSTVSDADGGQIVITNTTTTTIIGTFDFQGGNVHVTGTFIAPIP